VPTVLPSVYPSPRVDAPFTDAQMDAAAAVIRHIPRDQALGLRLIAAARACAAMHEVGAAQSPDPGVSGAELDMLLGRSQAAALARACAGGVAMSRAGTGGGEA
jgi:hypothetical protein